MCIGSDKFCQDRWHTNWLLESIETNSNNIEGATSPAWCELPHQCIYKQWITGKFASRPLDHTGRHSGSPGWFIGRIWWSGDRICAALIILNENVRITLKISLRFVPKVRINDIPALVQIMAWRRPGNKPLSKPMLVSLLTHICVTRLQGVNPGCTELVWKNIETYCLFFSIIS